MSREPYNRPFDSCLYPIQLHRDSKLYDRVPCGSCSFCQKRKQSSWQNRLYHHLTCGKFTSLFITLTYSNEHLPLVSLTDYSTSEGPFGVSEDRQFFYLNSSRTKFNRGVGSSSYSRRPLYSDFSSSDLDDYLSEKTNELLIDFPHYVLANINNTKYYDDSYTFAVASKSDIQDFVKRLRTLISRESSLVGLDCRFTYFICSEYGPTTFRPHYHGILFFNNQRVAEWCNSTGVFDAWKKQDLPIDSFGNKISSIVNNSEASAAYVSKYVTECSDLPFILRFPAFRSFHLQSISVPIGSLALPVSDIPDRLSQGDILFHSSYIDPHTHEQITIDRSFPTSFWHSVFPKFICHRLLDVSTISQLISRILQFKRVEDFPDLRKYVRSIYGIGQIVKYAANYNYHLKSHLWCTYNGKPINEGLYSLHLLAPRPFDYFRYVSQSPRVYKIIPSQVARRFLRCLGSDTDSLDLFLFGLEENLCAAKIIHRFVNSTQWCKHSQHFYITLYNQYFARVASDRFKYQYDYFNYHANILGTDSPALFDHIYNSDNFNLYFKTLHANYATTLRRQRSARIKRSETFDLLNQQL